MPRCNLKAQRYHLKVARFHITGTDFTKDKRIIQLPSAFPPPCAIRLRCHRWPVVLGDNSVLCLCFYHQQCLKNKTECWPFFGFFPTLFGIYGVQKSPTCVKKGIKIDQNGGLGWFWGLLGELLEAFGPQDGPKLKNHRKSDFVDPPSPKGPSGEPKSEKNMPWRYFL